MISIVVVGNIVDGLRFFGPFSDSESASEWADKNVTDEWVTATLESVDEPLDFGLVGVMNLKCEQTMTGFIRVTINDEAQFSITDQAIDKLMEAKESRA